MINTTMTDERIDRLIDVHSIQTVTFETAAMQEYIEGEVKLIEGCTLINDDGNIYVVKGEADFYPCAVSHTDTVHDIISDFQVVEAYDRLFAINGTTMEFAGIGGDDKVGVFVCLEVLRQLPFCKVAFFKDEEYGCLGSEVANMDFFKDVTCVLQCDRKGYNDFVDNIYGTALYSKAFSQAITPILLAYDRVETTGGLTDVCQLKENGLNVSCANMSCGYYRPHTDKEYIVISEVNATLEMVIEILESTSFKQWKHQSTAKPRYKNSVDDYYGKEYGYGGGGWGWNDRTYQDGYDKGEVIGGDDKNYDEIADLFDDPKNFQADAAVVECPTCNSNSQDMEYDEYEGTYWCFGCSDYVRATDTVIHPSTEDDSMENLPF